MSDKPHFLRKWFFTGIFFLIPIAITYWLLSFLIERTQGYARPIVEWALHLFVSPPTSVPEWVVTTFSLTLVFLFVLLVGWLANFYIGKKILNAIDLLMLRLPFVRSVYGGTKQILEAFSMQRSGSFKKVVLLEYPRRESWVLGFVTNEEVKRSKELYGRELAAVFVPSTPNPTTGFLLYLDPFDLYLVDLDVEGAVKLIVSAGLVLPPDKRNPPITLGEDLGLKPSNPEPGT